MRTHLGIPTPSGRRGLSLLELVIVVSVMGVIARALVMTTDGLGRVASTGGTQAVLQAEAEDAKRFVIRDLRRGGVFSVSTLNGKNYPYFSDDPDFDAHAHAPAESEAEAGDPDFGPSREIVFVMPADLDGDGRPELDADLNGIPELDGDQDGFFTDEPSDTAGIWDAGANTVHDDSRVVWSHDEISYVVNTAPDGINYLERRVNGGADSVRRVAKYVERVVFEDAVTADIPPDAVRMRLFLRKRTPEGVLMRHECEIWVSQRNGEDFVQGAGSGGEL